MRILIFSNIFEPKKGGGAEKVARRTAEYLAKNHEVLVVTTKGKGESYQAEEVIGNYSVKRLLYKNLYPYDVGKNDRSILKKSAWHVVNALTGVNKNDIEEVIVSYKADILYLHNCMAFMPNLASIISKLNIPVCAHLHDFAYICAKMSMFSNNCNCQVQCKSCALLVSSSRKNIQSFDAVISVSEFVKRKYLECGYFSGSNWYVINNTESDDSVPITSKRLKNNGTNFGYIGAISYEKGVDLVVDSFIKLNDSLSRLYVAGVGAESFVNLLKEKSLGSNVDWLGHVAINDFYKNIDVLVVSSRWNEPQGLVVVEAINRGIPIIISDRGGNTEIVNKYKAGDLFDPDMEGQLYEKMKNYSEFFDKKTQVLDLTPRRMLDTEYGFFYKVEKALIETFENADR